MRAISWSWLLLAWLCAWAGAVYSAEAPVVVLGDAPNGISLVGKTGFLEDEQGGLGIDELRSPSWDARFTVPGGLIQQSGLDGHSRWFKIRLRQVGPSGQWLIDSSHTAVRHFRAFGPYDAEGRALAPPFSAGISQPFAPSSLEGSRSSYRFQLDRPGDYTVYLQVESDFTDSFSFTVWDPVRFGQWEQGRVLFHGICYGLLIGVLVVNLMLLIGFRERLYGYNFLACLFALLSLAVINGHVGRYLLADARFSIPYLLAMAPALWLFFAGLFGSNFLDLPRQMPRLAKGIKFCLMLCPAAIALAAIGWFAWSIALIQAAGAIVPCLLFAGGVIVLRRGFRPAGWYLAGLSLLALASVGTTLKNYGWLDWSHNPYLALEIGIVVEVTVFVIALGSRIQRMRQRNGELGLRTKQLTTAAQTDPLTGLFNRAGWTLYGARLLAQGGQAAVLLIDLDHFKPVNDRHGHAAGDKVLSTVSRRMLAEVRGQGVLARLGGDEFAVLVADAPDPAALQRLAQRLIDLISQPVNHHGIALKVGASIGIACHPLDGADLGTLMHAADQAMYAVKQRGRAGFGFSADARPSSRAA